MSSWSADDLLHEHLGFSDTSLSSYLTSVAKKAKNWRDVSRVLEEGGHHNDTLAQTLWRKCSKYATIEVKQQERSNADWIKAAKNYELVDDDEEDDVRRDEKRKSKKSSSSSKSSKKHKKDRPEQRKKRKYRETQHSDSDSEDDVAHAISAFHQQEEERAYNRQTRKEPKLSVKEQEELERQRDLEERDALVARMLDRDSSKTKQKVKDDEEEAKYQKRRQTEEMLLRGETVRDPATGKKMNMDRLREESRRAYLKKREERELALLKQSIQDEKELFKGVKLTKAERKRMELGEQILNLAQDRENEKETQQDDFYRLPDEMDTRDTKANQDQALLTSRYIESKHEKTEQELWEESQTRKAVALGSRKKGGNSEDKQYDFVFEEQVDFVLQETTKGYDRRKDKKLKDESTMRPDPIDSTSLTEHEKILAGRKKLPVFPYRDEFLAAVKDHQVLILVGETGSGKTTQIPQYLDECGYGELGKIGCTQPRRLAAMSVAARVAQEMDVKLGHEVGYSIRFENCTSQKTRIQYMTDGMLLREILTEPDLASYSCMVIDEAHERTLHTDILFGLIKDIARFRNDLKLIVSSATLDAEKFSKYFDGASIFMIPGRMFPVDLYYAKAPEADYVDASVVTVLQIHITQELDGDILVFLTGQDEIETAAEVLAERTQALGSRIPELIICPVYANLPAEQQAKIFEKTPKKARKVVLATNIAETSLTINGICYVIDTGFNKQKTYSAKSGMESLVVSPISQAAANQRAGRAGRTQPGKCFRLYTSFSFQNELEPNTVPEILRSNMGNVVLMLKSLGINDLLNFDFMDRPPADALIRALEQLYALGALNDRGELTKLGRRMAEFPLDPMLSKTVIVSEKYKCTSEVLSTVSMLSLGASVFYRPKEKAVHADTARLNFARGGGGDHIALLRCYRDWAATDYNPMWCFENFVQVRSMKKARDIREQLEGLCERVEVDPTTSSPDDIDATLKAITAGFFYHVAKLGRSGEYQTVKQKKTVYIHPGSVMAKEDEPPVWLVYFELAFTTKEFMRQVAPIQPNWLVEIAPHYYQESEVEDTKSKKMPKGKR